MSESQETETWALSLEGGREENSKKKRKKSRKCPESEDKDLIT